MLKQRQEEYNGYREPGIRLSEPILPEVYPQTRSEADRKRLYVIHLFDKAHLTMLTEEQLIPREHGVCLLKALREMEQGAVKQAREQGGGNLHSGEGYLIRRFGEEVGGRMHLGRSSGDLGEVAMRIFIRDQELALMRQINQLRQVLIDLGRRHIDVVMPGYTFQQHAQPTTYGHQMLSWEAVLERDFDRIYANYVHMNLSPAGAAILTGTDFPINRQRVGQLLGFDGVEKNTMDAILSMDIFFDTQCVLSVLHMNLARWADDLILWTTSEFDMVSVPDRYCGTSSIMTQKKNFNAPQLIKGAASASVGGLMTAFLADKGPTATPILEHMYPRSAINDSFQNINRDIGWLIEMLPEIRVNRDLMQERAGRWWCQATDVSGMLVREFDLPWRTAHQIVGILVRISYERGLTPSDVTPELLDEASELYMGVKLGLSNELLQQALDPVASVNRRTLYGGPAPAEVLQRLHEYEEALAGDISLEQQCRVRVQAGLAELDKAVDALLEEPTPAPAGAA